MAMKCPAIIRDINIFVDGVGNLGVSKEAKLPDIKIKRQSLSRGGFEVECDMGIIEKLEAEFTLSEYNSIVYASMGIGIGSGLGVNITIKGDIFQGGKSTPAVASLQGSIDVEDGAWKAGGEIERKIKMSVRKYTLIIGGKPEVIVDADNQIAIIFGVDILESLRSSIQ